MAHVNRVTKFSLQPNISFLNVFLLALSRSTYFLSDHEKLGSSRKENNRTAGH